MLPSVSELVGDSAELCVRHARKLLPLVALVALSRPLLTILGLLGLYLNRVTLIFNPIINIVILVALPVLAFFSAWATLAIFRQCYQAITGPVDPAGAALAKTTALLWPAFYTFAIVLVIIFFGTLLLLVPGLILFIWYSFALNALVVDNKRGLAALTASKNLVVGRFFAVSWRLLGASATFIALGFGISTLLSFALTAAISTTVAADLITNSVSAIINACVAPFTVMAGMVLYERLKMEPAATVQK